MYKLYSSELEDEQPKNKIKKIKSKNNTYVALTNTKYITLTDFKQLTNRKTTFNGKNYATTARHDGYANERSL